MQPWQTPAQIAREIGADLGALVALNRKEYWPNLQPKSQLEIHTVLLVPDSRAAVRPTATGALRLLVLLLLVLLRFLCFMHWFWFCRCFCCCLTGFLPQHNIRSTSLFS